MITLATLRDEGLLDELARVFDSEATAKSLLETAGIPSERVQPFGQTSPLGFWEAVCREVEKGLIDGGFPALLRASAEIYPHNDAFRRGLWLLTSSPLEALAPAGSPATTATDRGPSPFITGSPIELDGDFFRRQKQRDRLHDAAPAEESVEGEFKPTGPPVSTPARLPNASSYSTLPVDVGTTWGLERGPFVGILEGGHGLQPRQALVRAEDAIRVAQARARKSPSLPSRRWFEVDAASLPLGPADETELWSAVRKGCGTSSVLDESEGLLGLFIPLKPRRIEEQLGICRGWIDGTYRLVPRHRVAIVFHAQGDEGIGTRLLNWLEGCSPVPMQLLRWRGSTEEAARTDDPSRAERDFMSSGKASSPSVHLASWLWSLFDADLIDSRALEDHHPDFCCRAFYGNEAQIGAEVRRS